MNGKFYSMVVFCFRIYTCLLTEINIEMGCFGILLNGIKRIVCPVGQTPLDPKIVITVLVVNVGIQSFRSDNILI